MKTNFFIVALLVLSSLCYAQQDSLKIDKPDQKEKRIFSLSPLSRKVEQVNGMVFGLGLDFNDNKKIKRINGINLEINPLSPFILLIADPSRGGFANKPSIVHYGLNISTGNNNSNEDVAIRGIGISAFNTGYSCDGLSVSAIYNYATNLNGLHISGIGNLSKNGNGMLVAIFNDTEYLKGMQLGLSNKVVEVKGVQIGLVNRAKKVSGLQLGLWNVSGKRSMPFLNW